MDTRPMASSGLSIRIKTPACNHHCPSEGHKAYSRGLGLQNWPKVQDDRIWLLHAIQRARKAIRSTGGSGHVYDAVLAIVEVQTALDQMEGPSGPLPFHSPIITWLAEKLDAAMGQFSLETARLQNPNYDEEVAYWDAQTKNG